MPQSEFDDAYEDDPSRREGEERKLGEAILNAPIRALGPRPAVVLPASAPVRQALEVMLAQGIGAVLVEDAGRTIGIFTERDVLRRVAHPAIDQSRPLQEVMTPGPETLGFDDGIAFALNRMILGGFRHIPIVDDKGAAVAVISLREVVAFIVALLPERVLNLPPEPSLSAHSTDGG